MRRLLSIILLTATFTACASGGGAILALGFVPAAWYGYTLLKGPEISDLAMVTVGRIGCASEDIFIDPKDVKKGSGGVVSWKAQCKDTLYYCSSKFTGSEPVGPSCVKSKP